MLRFKLAALVLMVSAAPVPASGLSAHAVPPIYPASTDYQLSVNGTSVLVVHYAGYDYTRFSMSPGAARLSLTKLNHTGIGSYSITPRKLGIAATVRGDTLDFTIDRDHYLIVKLDGRPELVIAADPAETDAPPSSGPGIFNVTSTPYLADNTGYAMTTLAMQRAVDDASAYGTAHGGQGVVYVPDGVYLMGNLVLKSNVSFYLHDDAVIRFTGDKADYTVNWHKASQNRDITWWITTAYDSHDITVHGRGTLDGNGYQAIAEHDFAANILAPIYTTNFTLDGITIRESGSWGVIPMRSQHLRFTNMKILNRFDMGEDDGIDVMESTDVQVGNAVGVALDDPFSTKTWSSDTDLFKNVPGPARELRHVVFDGVLSWTYCYGFKVGQGIVQPQTDVTFRNGVVYDAAVAIGVHHKWGAAPVQGVTFDNIDVENLHYSNDGHRTWLALFVQDGSNNGGGPISQVTVSNVTVRDKGTTAGVVKGISTSASVDNVTFRHVLMPGDTAPATSLSQLNVTDRAFADQLTVLPN